MVKSRMDKKIDSLEGALNAVQEQMEERDQRFTELQSSLGACNQHPGGRDRDLNREGVAGRSEVRD